MVQTYWDKPALLCYGMEIRVGLVNGVSVYFYNATLILLPKEFLYLFWFWRDIEFVGALAEAD